MNINTKTVYIQSLKKKISSLEHTYKGNRSCRLFYRQIHQLSKGFIIPSWGVCGGAVFLCISKTRKVLKTQIYVYTHTHTHIYRKDLIHIHKGKILKY